MLYEVITVYSRVLKATVNKVKAGDIVVVYNVLDFVHYIFALPAPPFFPKSRITSYNVCYTKLLRGLRDHGASNAEHPDCRPQHDAEAKPDGDFRCQDAAQLQP